MVGIGPGFSRSGFFFQVVLVTFSLFFLVSFLGGFLDGFGKHFGTQNDINMFSKF